MRGLAMFAMFNGHPEPMHKQVFDEVHVRPSEVVAVDVPRERPDPEAPYCVITLSNGRRYELEHTASEVVAELHRVDEAEHALYATSSLVSEAMYSEHHAGRESWGVWRVIEHAEIRHKMGEVAGTVFEDGTLAEVTDDDGRLVCWVAHYDPDRTSYVLGQIAGPGAVRDWARRFPEWQRRDA